MSEEDDSKMTDQDMHDYLCLLWDVMRTGKTLNAQDECDAGVKWNKVINYMVACITFDSSSKRIYAVEGSAWDMATGFLTAMMSDRPRPEQITQWSILVMELKKFAARKLNPDHYDVCEVLREALHKLERSGSVVRRGDSTRYRSTTEFALAGNDFNGIADDRLLEEIIGKIPQYGEKIRTSHTENKSDKKRYLKPSEADDLVKRVLMLLPNGVYITLKQLQDVAFQRIRLLPVTIMDEYVEETLGGANSGDGGDDDNASGLDFPTGEDAVTPEEDPDDEPPSADDGEGNPLEKADDEPSSTDTVRIPPDYAADIDLWKDVAINSATDVAHHIWRRIVDESGEEIFCLISLPSKFGNKKDEVAEGINRPKLKDFGDARRVHDRSEKYYNYIFKETKGLAGNIKSKDREFHNQFILVAGKVIIDKLVGRCTEKGYNPGL